ncbi:hypothetical protein WK39_27975 [Burkholderia cepacia]|uniref:hypothetical protein n=2 Tax=Burkholderia TaxID=32008 RepID=UPI000754EA2C|nr:hypothetical protein [Burkholderia cepacia]KVS50702.1 hypothetical protein WK39_27975 [Burkholderia cepacia]KVS65728.1 hypothetical protein WK40_12285 [Burkholderia cepacia]KWO54484.1 hypothetical protein WT98_09005 [Burkholderia territorii]
MRMLESSSDYMLKGVLLGLVIEAALATGVTVVSNSVVSIGDMASLTVWWSITVGLSLVVLLWKPVAALTFWTERLSPFVLKDDYRAMIVGRVVGVVLGLGFGITVAGTLI